MKTHQQPRGERISGNLFRRRAIAFLGLESGKGIKNRHLFSKLSQRFGIAIPTHKLERIQKFSALMGDFAVPTKRPIISSDEFYKSDNWRKLRYKAITLSDGLCQCCFNRPSQGNPLHVDHIKPRSKYPDLELELDNLQVLCEACNLGKSNTDETDWRESKGQPEDLANMPWGGLVQ